MPYNEGVLEPGQVVRMVINGPPFKVISVTDSRAYCVPMRKVLAKRGVDEVEFEGAQEGINVSPRAYIEIVEGDLVEAEHRRNDVVRKAREERHRESGDGGEAIPESRSPITGKIKESVMSASAMPVGKSTRDREKERRASNSTRRAAMPRRKLAGAAARSSARPKKERTVRKCFCGCGEETMGYFAPGHDGRFHGWMRKLEKGEMEPKELKKSIQDAIGPFKKVGEGFRPSKDYKGETYHAH